MLVITQIKRNDKVNGCNVLIFWLKKQKKNIFQMSVLSDPCTS